jgi:acetyl esterase/lipase
MNFSEYAEQIKALGRELSPEALGGTRAVIEPLISNDFLDGISVTRDIVYGDHKRHRLDVFREEGSSTLKPVLLFVHGGGFIAGDKHADGSPFYSTIGAWAANNGFAGVNMTYRLAPEHPWPAGSEDIRKAIEFIQSHGKEYGLDADNLFLMGQSAGGAHAAGYLAHPELYDNAVHGVKGAILLSAIYDYVAMPTTPMEQAYLGEDERLYFERSALAGLLEVDIPLLVSTAEYDPPKFQAQALQFLNAWQSKKGEMPGYVHMLGQNHLSVALYLGLPEDQLAPQLQRFIEEHRCLLSAPSRFR